jgi:hypothetical protein
LTLSPGRWLCYHGAALAPRRPSLLRLALVLAALAVSGKALAHGGDEGGSNAEESKAPGVRATLREESANPFRQSLLTLDQSFTTQTIGVGTTPLSYVPLYELWVSFRPRYYFDEHWSLRGRFDYTKEFTNDQATTQYREDVFGDVWTELVYRGKLDRLWEWTRADFGLRAIWPVSKASRANGTYVTLGPRGGVDHKFQIRGEDAPWMNNVHVGLAFAYMHPFTQSTTATDYGLFIQTGQDDLGRAIQVNQITGQPLPEHIFLGLLDSGLQITPRLSLSADFILLNYWHYAPTGNVAVPIAGGLASVGPPVHDNQFTQNIWVLAALDYTPIDELTLSIGYTNSANSIAPDGQARTLISGESVWWSPDARFFFDLSANLDVLFDDLRARPSAKASNAKTPPETALGRVRSDPHDVE